MIYQPHGKTILTTLYTDADGYYMFAYKHTSRSGAFYVEAPAYGLTRAISVKANGFAGVYFDMQ